MCGTRLQVSYRFITVNGTMFCSLGYVKFQNLVEEPL